MSIKYDKFVFQDLPKTAVVNIHDDQEVVDPQKEELINAVVTQHLNTILNGEQNNFDIKPEEDNVFDIDQIKLENYNKGLDDAKAQYEPLINELQYNKHFAEVLHQKLSEITPELNIDVQLTTLTTQLIENIAKKIYLILPVDFERILRSELLEKIKKFYKRGVIKLTINPARYDLCANVLELENLPAKFKDNLEIVQDENYGLNDCKVEWDNTCLEYSQNQLAQEIDKILEQLRSK